MNFKFEALLKLAPNAKFYIEDGVVTWNSSDITQPTEKEINDKVAELKAEYEANQYQRDRAEAYPSWQDQMDLLYHGGVDALKAELKKTKDKYPKPT
jgi:hypothetical protein